MITRDFALPELNHCHANLQNWRRTDPFVRHVDYLQRRCANVIDQNWWREAWEASQFARLSAMHSVRLTSKAENENRGFDFEVRTKAGSTVKVQSTLVEFEQGRLTERVREHRRRMQAATGGYFFTPRCFDADVILQKISEGAQNKSKKPPRFSDTVLMLHVNMPASDQEHRKVATGCQLAVCAASGVYQSIWVLHNRRLLRCWPNPWDADPCGLRPNKTTFPMGARLSAYRSFREIGRYLGR